jgi:hypothetical protein
MAKTEIPEIFIMKAQDEHAAVLAPLMRKADADEVYATAHWKPEEALRKAIAFSEGEAYAVYLHGELACLFGVGRPNLMGRVAIPWLLTGSAVDKYPLTFYRNAKKIFKMIVTQYPCMMQRVDSRYTSAVELMKRLGFKIHPPEPFGPDKVLFHTIVYEEKK